MTPEELAKDICSKAGLTFIAAVGSGAFKNTFHIKTADGESRALKLYKGSRTERSDREIEAMTRCDHPHISKFLSLDTIKIGPDIISYAQEEFLPGGALTIRVGTIPTGSMPGLALPLVRALEHVAGLRLVHRDLKPDNIMFRDGSHDAPVIVDFGLVRNLEDTSLTASWNMRGPGTPYYAAPEQLNNEKGMIDWRTDQFGLGITLAFAWLNKHPYQGQSESSADAVDRVATWGQPTTSFISLCSAHGLQVLAKMVQPFPVQRFRTPQELSHAWSHVVVTP